MNKGVWADIPPSAAEAKMPRRSLGLIVKLRHLNPLTGIGNWPPAAGRTS